MFKRKRHGGTARAIVFGAMAIGALFIPTSSGDPNPIVLTGPPVPVGSTGPGNIQVQTTTYTYYPAGYPKGSGGGSNIFLSVIFVGISITGITQASKFSETNRQIIIQGYRNGNGIPKKYMRFHRKDFRQ